MPGRANNVDRKKQKLTESGSKIVTQSQTPKLRQAKCSDTSKPRPKILEGHEIRERNINLKRKIEEKIVLKAKGGGIREENCKNIEDISKSETEKKNKRSNPKIKIKVVGPEIESVQKQFKEFLCYSGEKGQLIDGTKSMPFAGKHAKKR